MNTNILSLVGASEGLIGYVQEAITPACAKRFNEYYAPRLQKAVLAVADAQRSTPPPNCVGELLAVLCQDGGHYLDEHGLEAACKLGIENYYAQRDPLNDRADEVIRSARAIVAQRSTPPPEAAS